MAYDVKAAERLIRESASRYGVNPNIAVKVARSEGLAGGVYQSNLSKGGTREPSYGPFQLLVGGPGTNYPAGMGNDFIRQTGLDPRDPSTVPDQIDFAMRHAASNGWGAWYGAKKVGVGNRDGIPGGTRGGGGENVASSTNDSDFGGASMAGYGNRPGGLGGLGGMPVEPEPEGVMGFLGSAGFGDWLQAAGASLMSSPSNNQFQDFGQNLSSRQALRQRQDALEVERAEKANDRAALESLLVARGFAPDQARAFSTNSSVANAAIAGRAEDEERQEKNQFQDWLKANHPDLVGLPTNVAWNAASLREREGKEGSEAAQRRQLAVANGLDPDTPEGQRYVLTGSLPAADKGVTAGDRQAIREADDVARDGEGVLGLLDEALKLSPESYEGATAGARTWAGNNLPDWLVPDAVADEKTAQATRSYDNIITTQALGSLKAIFGGAPTEGERAILLEVQGMSSQPKKVREEIIKRAKSAVQRRVEFNRDRANELRGGTYYKPRGESASPAAAPVPAPAAAPTVPASDADPLGLR